MKSQLKNKENVFCFAKWILCICLPWRPCRVNLAGTEKYLTELQILRSLDYYHLIVPFISSCTNSLK